MLAESGWRRWALGVLCAAALFFLYFFGLTRSGLLGPDEPRYAAIGQAMAQSGDWVTPRLWGEPWFEKPALLYWMTAAGFKAGLDQDLAPRLPVALASVAFLIYFFVALGREFGARTAFYATTILATSAGWLAYSHVAVTDLPMSAAFSAAMLALMRGPLAAKRGAVPAGVLLGLAILAKGLVPLALLLPALWSLRRRIRDLLLVSVAAAVVAAPWYALVTWRNGTPFLEEFFVKHHFGRLASAVLGHAQPFWFYAPVLLAGILPWTPMLALLFRKAMYKDTRVVFLLAWPVWGLIFFSVFLNKLPGYLLPLLPPVAALLGIALVQAKPRSIALLWSISISAAMLSFIPSVQDLLPDALVHGLSHTHYHVSAFWILPAFAGALLCSTMERVGHRSTALGLIALGTSLLAVRVVWVVYPALDQIASGRSVWLSHSESITCIPASDRFRRYSLDYYAGRNLPDCN